MNKKPLYYQAKSQYYKQHILSKFQMITTTIKSKISIRYQVSSIKKSDKNFDYLISHPKYSRYLWQSNLSKMEKGKRNKEQGIYSLSKNVSDIFKIMETLHCLISLISKSLIVSGLSRLGNTANLIYTLLILAFSFPVSAQNTDDTTDVSEKTIIYTFSINREIGSTAWIYTQNAFQEAMSNNADVIILHLNTYGGEVIFADSIRTKILNSKIPVHVFIDNNAASAGALISIACDKIFMRPGANIGAATVVNQSGEKMPDKYQSYMRSTIRATAEAHGKDTIINNSDTVTVWKRDPHIAEAMVDESINIEGIIDSGKILTFTTNEAIKHGFCDGKADSMEDVISQLGYKNYELISYKPNFYSGLKGFLTSPVIHGILILVIIGGLYFELQSPGIGFPLLASVVAAVLYFAPLYLDGLAANWEIIIFIIGIVLIGLEIFVVPGFGITGISGIILVFTGLTLSLVNNVVFDFSNVPTEELLKSLIIVAAGSFLSFIIAIPLSQKLFSSGPLAKVALQSSQNISEGYISVDANLNKLIGESGIAETTLRPSGKIVINDEPYDAIAESGIIFKGDKVKVTRFTAGQLYVVKLF